jgi:hypothetical protein
MNFGHLRGILVFLLSLSSQANLQRSLLAYEQHFGKCFGNSIIRYGECPIMMIVKVALDGGKAKEALRQISEAFRQKDLYDAPFSQSGKMLMRGNSLWI